MLARLTVHLPEQASSMHLIEADVSMVIGRDPSCDVQISHHSVSRRHARLDAVDGHWRLHDLGSKNGTRVHGERIETPAELVSPAWFAAGDVLCQLQTMDVQHREAIAARARERRHASTVWSARLQSVPDERELLGTLIRGIVELAECHRGFFMMSDGTGEMHMRACLGLSPRDLASPSFSGSRGAIDRAIVERRPVFLSDLADNAGLRDRGSVIAHGIRALVCLPVEHEGELIGIAYADTIEAGRAFTQLDSELLLAFAAHAGASLAVARLDRRLTELASWLAVGPKETVEHQAASLAWTGLVEAPAPGNGR